MYGMRGMPSATTIRTSTATARRRTCTWPRCPGRPAGRGWALHVWEHYLFTKDLDFLRRMYPAHARFGAVLCGLPDREATESSSRARPCRRRTGTSCRTDMTRPFARARRWTTRSCASFSPHASRRSACWAWTGPFRDAYGHCRAAAGGSNRLRRGSCWNGTRSIPSLRRAWGTSRTCLPATPASAINWRDAPELLRAARKSLELRVENGAGEGGWPLAWYINHIRAAAGRQRWRTQSILQYAHGSSQLPQPVTTSATTSYSRSTAISGHDGGHRGVLASEPRRAALSAGAAPVVEVRQRHGPAGEGSARGRYDDGRTGSS